MPTYTADIPELGRVKFDNPDELDPAQVDGILMR